MKDSPVTGVKVHEFLAKIPVEQKATLVSGKDLWRLEEIPELGLPGIMVTDGPHGLRKQRDESGGGNPIESVPAVCFPCPVNLASTWDTDLIEEVGGALADACLQERVSILLGPGVNIKRSPLCGRNFEYFSEDPYLTGMIASAWIRGVQGKGIGACLKHFAANNQESNRMIIDTIVDERTLREIYLPGFEISVKKGQPWTVMCSYNRLNGEYLSDSSRLLNSVLREEWNFRGLVMTDWGALNDPVQGLAAGVDLEMPGSGNIHVPMIQAAIEGGELSPAQLDNAAKRVIDLIIESESGLMQDFHIDESAQHELACKVAEQSFVLLQNHNAALPLNSDEKIVVIGELARNPRYQGTGSSQISPTRLSIPLDAIEQALSDESVLFAPGYSLSHEEPDERMIDEAVLLASTADKVVLFLGLPETRESEAIDRQDMCLPEGQLALVDALCDLESSMIVVLQNGAPVELPFRNKVHSILETFLGGQAYGSAVALVLFGQSNPCGKLAESFPEKLSDTPCHHWFPGERRQVEYREGIYVGYRYYCTSGVATAYPFGHGLSYTTYDYSNLRITRGGETVKTSSAEEFSDWDGLIVWCDIRNSGDREGAEIVQLYVRAPNCTVHRPSRELRGFAKVFLLPGESRSISFELGKRAFSFWDVTEDDWALEGGEFVIELGASSEDIRLSDIHQVNSDWESVDIPAVQAPYFNPALRCFDDGAFAALLQRPIPKQQSEQPYHMNSTLSEISRTHIGAILYRLIKTANRKRMGAEAKESHEQLIDAVLEGMPLRMMVMFSKGKFSYKYANLLLQIVNRNIWSAFKIAIGIRSRSSRNFGQD